MNVAQRLTSIDVRLMYWSLLQRQRLPVHYAARYLSLSGDGYLQVMCVLWFAFWPHESSSSLALWVAYVFAGERAVYFVLKNSLKRQRPPAALPSFEAAIKASDQFSFPSGHTSAAFVLVTVFGLLDFTLFWFALVWAIGVGASRVILGVHYPSDIIAGASLGVSMVFLVTHFSSFSAIL
jgi:undecaprenyl-diphosphatase